MSSFPGALTPQYPTLSARLGRLEAAIRAAPRILVDGVWVRDLAATIARVPPPGGAAPEVLWPGGTAFRHNRYVRQGAFPALHLGDGLTTVGAEVFGVSPSPAPRLGVPRDSRVQVRVEVYLPEVLDLADHRLRRRLGIRKADLTAVPDWTVLDVHGRPLAYELPQSIGELAYNAGLGGIRYPSAHATRGVNLVVFTDHLALVGGRIRAEDPFTGSIQSLP